LDEEEKNVSFREILVNSLLIIGILLSLMLDQGLGFYSSFCNTFVVLKNELL